MCRMRSIKDTAKYFQEMDPESEITESTLRRMIAEGTIPVVKTGCKFLINLDLLLDKFGMEQNVPKYAHDHVFEK